MPEAARDARFQLGRIRPVRKHIGVVVAFEHQRVATGQIRFDVRRRAARVGQDAQPTRAVGEHVLDRLACVMRHGKRLHQKITDRETTLRIDQIERALVGARAHLAQGGERSVRQPHRDAEAARERKYAFAVVGVLVRDDYSGEIGRLEANAGQA